jgi:hypothetical protein
MDFPKRVSGKEVNFTKKGRWTWFSKNNSITLKGWFMKRMDLSVSPNNRKESLSPQQKHSNWIETSIILKIGVILCLCDPHLIIKKLKSKKKQYSKVNHSFQVKIRLEGMFYFCCYSSKSVNVN